MDRNKVKLNICGNEYCLTADEDPQYMIELGTQLDNRLSKILRENPYLSITQAAVFAALEYADAEKKASFTAENLRSQIQEYLEDSARARTDAEVAKREAERLRKELETYRNK